MIKRSFAKQNLDGACKAESLNRCYTFFLQEKIAEGDSIHAGFDHKINKSPRYTIFMELAGKEKKLLTILHEARLIDGKLLNDYEKEIKKHFSFSDEELNKAIKKFLESGLLEEIKLKDNEVMYMHTKKVSQKMTDSELSEVGH